MSSELEKALEEIRKELWADYTETVIDHAQHPRNVGSVPNADGFARVTGPCGDTMQISLKVADGKVRDIAFWTDGCGTSIAAGSMVTELASAGPGA
jgi:nitrogen fixation NifU-like protein